MRSLTADELLQVWENSQRLSLHDRALYLLSVACNADMHTMATLPVGERDARLLQLRERMFGNRLPNVSICPQCGEKAEWEQDSSSLHLQEPDIIQPLRTCEIETNGYTVRFRLPDSRDMALAIRHQQPEQLICNCILEACCGEQPCTPDELPLEVLTAIDAYMSSADPQADIRILVSCPACTHEWEARFDIGTYLWAEVRQQAVTLLQEVDLLARTYGWSEQDILQMSPVRRQYYLQMTG